MLYLSCPSILAERKCSTVFVVVVVIIIWINHEQLQQLMGNHWLGEVAAQEKQNDWPQLQ